MHKVLHLLPQLRLPYTAESLYDAMFGVHRNGPCMVRYFGKHKITHHSTHQLACA